MKSSINGIGKILPITDIGKATVQSTPKSAAAIRPPLSSKTGKREMIKTISSSDSHELKKLVMDEIIESILSP